MKRNLNQILILALLFQSSQVWAWGQRGHELVTLVASRLLQEDPRVDQSFAAACLDKEHLLAHLANTPDTVWRRGNGPNVQANRPTHFVDMEYLDVTEKRGLKKLPQTGKDLISSIRQQCKLNPKNCAEGSNAAEQLSRAGHAPLRIAQLTTIIEQSFRKLKIAKNKSEKLDHFHEAIVAMGLLSHFVGDLGNPLHTSSNYNGQLTGQSGIHSYFETFVVNEYPLDLSHRVFLHAQKQKPYKTRVTAKKRVNSYLDSAWALAWDSHKQLNKLLALDKKHSLVKEAKAMEKPQRKAAKSVGPAYKTFTVAQLATAADTLKELWVQAWLKAGKPSLAGLKSYHFPTEPDFVPVRYLEGVK